MNLSKLNRIPIVFVLVFNFRWMYEFKSICRPPMPLNSERIDQITPDAAITSSNALLDERGEAETSKYYVLSISAMTSLQLLSSHLKV